MLVIVDRSLFFRVLVLEMYSAWVDGSSLSFCVEATEEYLAHIDAVTESWRQAFTERTAAVRCLVD